MKKTILTLSILLLLLTAYTARPQNPENEVPIPGIKGFYAGGQAATSGFGFDLRYIFNNRFSIKSGFESLNFSHSFDFEENDLNYQATFDYKTGGVFLVADYFYAKGLYISAGAATNSLNPKVKGKAVEGITYGDINIPASKVGNFMISMEPDLKLSPYAGIGFRSFIGSAKKVVYNFETGLYYLGPPKVEIEADGLLAPTADPAHGKKELLEEQFSVYKIYPVVKLNLAFKLF